MLKRRKKKETYTAAVVSAWEVALFWTGICGGLPEGVPVGFSGGVPPCCPSGACPPGALLGLTVLGFGEQKTAARVLKITIPESLDYDGLFDDIFAQYTRRCTLTRVKTSNMGTLYELEYAVLLPEDVPPKAFLDALRCRNGSDPIPEDTLVKLFDRFYRAAPSRNAATGGFGIGLSIARSIAEAHRGSICARMAGEEVEFAAELR